MVTVVIRGDKFRKDLNCSIFSGKGLLLPELL